MKETSVSKWLHKRFLEWQLQSEKKKTVVQFATYLGVARGTLNQWMNGERTPTGLYVNLIADKLGPEIYDVLGLARPKQEPVDPLYEELSEKWRGLNADAYKAIKAILAKDAAEKAAAANANRQPDTRAERGKPSPNTSGVK